MSSSPSFYKQLGLGAGSPFSGRHILLFILGAGFLVFTVFVVHPNEFRIQSFFSTGCTPPGTDAAPPVKDASAPHAATTEATQTPAPDDVRLLIGIQTLPGKYERRHLLRTVYSLQVQEQPSLAGRVDVRFIFCNVTSPDDAVFVALEIMRYDDIIVMDCAENMDNGKTYTFFSTVARAFNGTDGPRYDYVMKADDDTYLRLPALVASLRGAAREDAYYGLQMPCDRENFYPFPPFMSGMGYALSWDLVQWVAASELSARDHKGPEDMWTGRWLNFAGKAKNRYDNAPRMYNYKGASPDSCFRHGFVPDTIAVHMLKDDARWAETLRYFNATAALPRSDLYHLPLPASP
ncbi:beta-1,3-galactosyltransferase pvg3-like [Phragmites australis]|uniref:beta-1,3-galactosyltransferase pvg3-like n=1 Tax=Phragmites australis TaxID=29695 RepID=UPI002D78712C|nr:beta-1,3-galactosyltransferase pvg3-like [Phragmites australis]